MMVAKIGQLQLAVLLALAIPNTAVANEIVELRMPGVQPQLNDSYLCTSMPLDTETEHFIVGFKPMTSMQKAHHILIFGCEKPGSFDDVWDCGEMTKAGASFDRAPTCNNQPSILYAWGRDAKQFRLPEGVGFKVGGETRTQYIVMQVHYMHKLDSDYSGVAIESTSEPLEKTASTLLLVTGGTLLPKKRETFEAACVIDEDVELHPFAIRPHTHDRGEMVSGWVVREDANGKDKWEMIGERNPLLPQIFQAVKKDISIQRGDTVAARCVMNNKDDKEYIMGNTGDDEMCNFYIMYWVWGDNILSDNTCYSPGAPEYHWASEAGLNNIPII